MKSFLLKFIPILIIVLGFFVYSNWYKHVESGDSPYDGIFTTINGMMPAPARDWACGRIAERFEGTLPPHSC